MLLLFMIVVGVGYVNATKYGIIHMHGVLEGFFDHNNFQKFVERNTGIPVHLINVSLLLVVIKDYY